MTNNVRIKDLHPVNRPREKLKRNGVSTLSDFELSQILVGSGVAGSGVELISRNLVTLLKVGVSHLTLEKLLKIKGVSFAKGSKILAALELSRRYLSNSVKPTVSSEKDILPFVHEIRDKKQEHFVVISLNSANAVIEVRTITIGTLNASLVHPREVFADVITDRAASIICVHNHPSGDVNPSYDDVVVTNQLIRAGALLGIDLIDHLIVTKSDIKSMRDTSDCFEC